MEYANSWLMSSSRPADILWIMQQSEHGSCQQSKHDESCQHLPHKSYRQCVYPLWHRPAQWLLNHLTHLWCEVPCPSDHSVLTLWVEGDGHDGGEGRRDVAGDIGQGRQTDVGELAHLLGARSKKLHLKVVLGAVWEAPGPSGVMHPLIIYLTVPQPSV